MHPVADRLERAWAAGFFDGDGWAGAGGGPGRRTRQPAARINQASGSGLPEVLSRFRAAVGGAGRVGGPQTIDRRLPLDWWVASSRGDVECVLQAIGPWLCNVKKAQFAVALGLPTIELGERHARESSEEAAWAAGLFDAEGCVSLSAHRTHDGYAIIEAALTQASSEPIPPVLGRFKEAVGDLGCIYGPYSQPRALQRVFRWRLLGAAGVAAVVETMRSRLGAVKVAQADHALAVVTAQPPLPRGNPSWGAYKTHCVHGHEYAAARVRPYRSRGVGVARRENAQCLVCARDQARAKRSAMSTVAVNKEKSGGPGAAALLTNY